MCKKFTPRNPMKTNLIPTATPVAPSEADIRDFAYHLYVQGGSIPGRDLEDWLEAEACLRACIPAAQSQGRLHHHLRRMGRALPAAGASDRKVPRR